MHQIRSGDTKEEKRRYEEMARFLPALEVLHDMRVLANPPHDLHFLKLQLAIVLPPECPFHPLDCVQLVVLVPNRAKYFTGRALAHAIPLRELVLEDGTSRRATQHEADEEFIVEQRVSATQAEPTSDRTSLNAKYAVLTCAPAFVR